MNTSSPQLTVQGPNSECYHFCKWDFIVTESCWLVHKFLWLLLCYNGRVEVLPKILAIQPCPGHRCQHLFSMLSNGREDRTKEVERPWESSLVFPQREIWRRTPECFPCSSPSPKWARNEKRISRPEQDLKLGWGEYSWDGRLRSNWDLGRMPSLVTKYRGEKMPTAKARSVSDERCPWTRSPLPSSPSPAPCFLPLNNTKIPGP